MKSRLTIIAVMFLWISASFGQNENTKRIRGIVINQISGLSIDSVHISSSNSAYTATTNKDGGMPVVREASLK